MATNDRDERLHQFFSGQFHEDWDCQGANSWKDVVAEYVHTAPKAQVIAVQNDLRSWLAETAACPGAVLPGKFGNVYDPLPDGLSEREWIEQMADLLGRLLTN